MQRRTVFELLATRKFDLQKAASASTTSRPPIYLHPTEIAPPASARRRFAINSPTRASARNPTAPRAFSCARPSSSMPAQSRFRPSARPQAGPGNPARIGCPIPPLPWPLVRQAPGNLTSTNAVSQVHAPSNWSNVQSRFRPYSVRWGGPGHARCCRYRGRLCVFAGRRHLWPARRGNGVCQRLRC